MNSDVGRRYIRRRGDAEGVEVDCGGVKQILLWKTLKCKLRVSGTV